MTKGAARLLATTVIACSVLFGSASTGPQESVASNPDALHGARFHERFGLTGDGRLYRAGALIGAEVANPELLLDRLYPGSWPVSRPGEASAVFDTFARWSGEDLPAVVHYNGAGAPKDVDLVVAIQWAVGTWNGALGQDFRFHNAGTTAAVPQSCTDDNPDSDGVNTIAWGELNGNVLGATCTIYRRETDGAKPRIVEFDVTMSPNIPWSTAAKTPADAFDLLSVVLHEFGHALGLDHTEAEDAVMQPRISRGTQYRKLSKDDLAGLIALYSNGKTPPAVGPRPHIRVAGAIAKDR